VVTDVVAAKCSSNPNGIFNNNAHSKLRSDGKGKDREQVREGERMEVNEEARDEQESGG